VEQEINKTKFSRSDIFIYSFFFFFALFFIWHYRFLPLQDYPDWVYEGYVFHRILTGSTAWGYHVLSYPVPNSISTFIIGLLNFFFLPETCGKIFLTLYLFCFIFASVYFINSLQPSKTSILSFLPFVLFFNYPFFHGFLNYMFSLCFFFAGMGYILRRRNEEEKVSFWVIAVFSILIFFSHAVIFMGWLLFIFCMVLTNLKKEVILKYALGLLPALIMLFLYTLNRVFYLHNVNMEYFENESLPALLMIRALIALNYCSLTHSFYPHRAGDIVFPKLFMGVNILAFCFFIGLTVLWFWVFVRLRKKMYFPLGLTTLAFIIVFFLAPNYVGNMLRPYERFVYPILWSICACLAPFFNEKLSSGATKYLKIAVFCFLVVQCFFVYDEINSVSKAMARTYWEIKQAHLSHNFMVIDESHFKYQGLLKTSSRYGAFLPLHAPFYRLHHYLAMEEEAYAHVFTTGILVKANRVYAPNSVSSLLRMRFYPREILVIGEEKGNKFIAQLLQRKYRLKYASNYMVILARK